MARWHRLRAFRAPQAVSCAISPTTATLTASTTQQFTATVSPSTAPQDGLWYSSAPSVVSVDARTGFATPGSSTGSATITFHPLGHDQVTATAAVSVLGSLLGTVASFNALTAAGASQDVPAGNVLMVWDTKYGPAPTLVSGGTLYSTQDPAYVAGGEPSLTMHGGVDSVTDWGTPSWDAVLSEVNSLTGSTAGVIRTIASAALNMATRPMTFWVLTTGHNSKPSANGTLGSVRAAASDSGFGGETGLSLRFTDSVANGKYYPQILYHNNASGKEEIGRAHV